MGKWDALIRVGAPATLQDHSRSKEASDGHQAKLSVSQAPEEPAANRPCPAPKPAEPYEPVSSGQPAQEPSSMFRALPEKIQNQVVKIYNDFRHPGHQRMKAAFQCGGWSEAGVQALNCRTLRVTRAGNKKRQR